MKKSSKITAIFLCFVMALCSAPAAYTASSAAQAPITYTVTLIDNADGTATVTAALPAGTASGKIVVTPSANLIYIGKSLKTDVTAPHLDPDGDFAQAPISSKNDKYDKDGVTGQCVTFVGPVDPHQPDYRIPEGTIALKANYTIAAGAELSADDIVVNVWDFSDGEATIANQDVGDVNKIFLPACTVNFKDWDGRLLKTMKVRNGSAATAPNAPDNKPNWHFTGWDKAFDSVTADTVVNAQYAIDTFTVTFKDWDGRVIKSETVDYGAAATAPAAPATKPNWHFTGWDKSCGSVTADTVVNAQYAIDTFTVSFISDGHGGFEGETSVTVDYGTPLASVVKPVPAADSNYIFYKWSEPSEANVTADLEIHAAFALLGDVNENGKTENVDAATILRYDVNIISFTDYQLFVGDVNGDGQVDNLDAAQILQYDAGLIMSF